MMAQHQTAYRSLAPGACIWAMMGRVDSGPGPGLRTMAWTADPSHAHLWGKGYVCVEGVGVGGAEGPQTSLLDV